MRPTVARRYSHADSPACQTTSRRALRTVRHLCRAAKALPAGISRDTVTSEARVLLACVAMRDDLTGREVRRGLRLGLKLDAIDARP